MRRLKVPSWALAILTVALLAIPLLMVGGRNGASDDQGSAAVEQLQPGYTPWVRPLWTPPSRDVESGLFAIQAAAGASVIAYYIGYRRGQRRAGGGGK